MKKFLLLFLFPFSVFAQNLVPNWSFEAHSSCPTDFNQVTLSTGWKRCHENNDVIHHTDYMHVCGGNNGTSYFTVPYNVWGYQYAATGDAYVALSTTALNLAPDYRENIYRQLLQPTIVGVEYTVSMKVSKSNKTKNATNRIGIKLSTDSTFAINNSSQLHADTAIADTSQWILLTTTFTADSAYDYIAVGNFYTDDSTTIVNVCSSCPQVPSEYLIDDICIHRASETDCTQTVELSEIVNNSFTIDCFRVDGSLDIIFNTEYAGSYSFNVWNLVGQRISTTQRFCSSGTSTFSLPIEVQSSTALLIQATDANFKSVQKLVITSK